MDNASERELRLELKFWKDLALDLMNSDDTGFVTMEEAQAITGLNRKKLRRHTQNICGHPYLVPVPWIKWYMRRRDEGFVKLPKSDLDIKKPQP